jgi:hypothetical protein
MPNGYGQLLGLALNQPIADLKAHIRHLKNDVALDLKRSLAAAGVTLGLLLAGAIAALMTIIVGLISLFVWVDGQYGAMAALAAVAAVTGTTAVILFVTLAVRGRPSGPNASPAAAQPGASPHVPPPPPGAPITEILTHRVAAHAYTLGEAVARSAADTVRASSRPAIFGMIALVAFAGWTIGRRR